MNRVKADKKALLVYRVQNRLFLAVMAPNEQETIQLKHT